jgi:glucosylceramidase
MSCGWSPYNEYEWITDAELYANEIIGNINAGMNIFVDWNLLLDENGGPNHKNNFVKSPIIRDDDQIVLTPIYHYLKHISLHQEQLVHQVIYDKLKVLATKKDDKYIITILNNTNDDINFNMKDMVKDTINKHTIVTYII